MISRNKITRKSNYRLSANDIKSAVSDAIKLYMKDFQDSTLLEIEKLKREQDEKICGFDDRLISTFKKYERRI